MAQEEFLKKNNKDNMKDFFDNIKKFAKLKNKMNLLNI